MTNEITIDGVNVAECKFFKQSGLADKCYLYVDEYGGSDCFCENNKNCYYKQLQRLKQENEKLKLEKRKESRCPHYCLGECSLTDGGNENGNCIGFRNCFEKLEQENEELKERNLVIESRADEVITEYEKLRLHVESLKSQNENLYTERTQLKQKNEELLTKNQENVNKLESYSQKCEELISQLDFTAQKLEVAEQKNEELETIYKTKLKLKNAPCEFFEGQTGLCRAKEFKRCNPINCKEYTMDSFLTIKKYQQALKDIQEIVMGMRSIFIEETEVTTASQLSSRIYRESVERFKLILQKVKEVLDE